MDVERVREQFPALKSGFIFADSAGGSQIHQDVIIKITDYLTNTNVQLGADYSVGKLSSQRVYVEAPQATATLFNAKSPDEIAFSSSSTMAVENLARSLESDFFPGEEIIVTSEHEANVGPWVRAASRRNAVIRTWNPRPTSDDNPFSVSLRVEDLLALISAKTRFLALSACSNILGELLDIASIVKAIRTKTADLGTRKTQICVDCVAFAPHRRVDVQSFGVDFAVVSYYKVYGPHVSAMYTRLSAYGSMQSLAHYFIDPNSGGSYPPSMKISPGGPGYELTYATSAVLPYLISLGNSSASTSTNDALNLAFERIKHHEGTLIKPLIEFLIAKRALGVRIVGLASIDPSIRAPTVSFVVVGPDGKTKRLTSKSIVEGVDTLGNIGIRYGHFYAHRLLTFLGLDPDDGVVRVSLVHYNTVEEVNAIIRYLDKILE